MINKKAIPKNNKMLAGAYKCFFTYSSVVAAIFLLLTVVQAFGQVLDEKYADAYKKYLNAPYPLPDDGIRHFVYFSRDREAIIGHPLLTNHKFSGAQIMYSWKELEPEKDLYDFSKVKEDYEYLKKYDKKLFIQLQDMTFDSAYKAVPAYLLTDEYDGGSVLEYTDEGKPAGWVAKRWSEKVRKRFSLLLNALGREFDGKIEGVNLQETSIGGGRENIPDFSEEKYVRGLKANMLALKKAFPKSTTMQYANFMPGEWLPYEDKGYLRSLYQYGEEIGVGLGGPDLMVSRKAQLNHCLKLMHEGTFTVPLGIAVQDGNYTGKTGADLNYNKNDGKDFGSHTNIVPMLYNFAKDFLKVSYMFWVNQEPYFEEDVIPCFSSKN